MGPNPTDVQLLVASLGTFLAVSAVVRHVLLGDRRHGVICGGVLHFSTLT